MKQKDIMYLVLAVVILLVAGYVGYTQLVPQKPSSKVVEVDKIGPIPASLNAKGLAAINDSSKVRDFSTPVDLSGLGNQAVFGP